MMKTIIRIVLNIGEVNVNRKQSKQREMVLNYVKNMEGHACAEEIHNGINQKDAKVSLATIYRNLNILVEMNEIKKLSHPIFGYIYDKSCIPHDHFYCRECHNFTDIDMPYVKELDEDSQERTGLIIHAHSTLYEGICKSCQKKYLN